MNDLVFVSLMQFFRNNVLVYVKSVCIDLADF